MTGEVVFTWGERIVRASLDDHGRWHCNGPPELAALLNRSCPVAGLVGRRIDVDRDRLKAAARRFGGKIALPHRHIFPPPRYPEDHPGYIRLRGRPRG